MTSRPWQTLELLAGSFAITTAALAQTTVVPLFESDTDTLGNPLTYPGAAAAELHGSIVTLEPGRRTGWHAHSAPTFGYVLSGRLTVEYATGERRVFGPDRGVIEAQHTPHDGRNDGDEPVRMLVFSAAAPGVPPTEPADPPRPDDFVALRDLVPGLVIELRYFGTNNFVGRPIAGYETDSVLLTHAAAAALGAVQATLAARGLGLKVFDGYRPQRAVDDFVRWAADPSDTAMRSAYYPTLDKSALIPNGYIAARSGHSRGSTVDLTLVRLATAEEIDMGSPYDYFDPISWPASSAVPRAAHANRMTLREVMLQHGFVPLEEEWWHFTLRDEPYPDRYFDFPIR